MANGDSEDRLPRRHAQHMRGRKLLHWVNSLPIAVCLLVESLADLRFGDVLVAIAGWLQTQRLGLTGDHGAGTEKIEAITTEDGNNGRFGGEASLRACVRRDVANVVQFATQECRSGDERALHLVNDDECITRIMDGDDETIAALVTILKRVSEQIDQVVVAKKAAAQQRRRQEFLDICKRHQVLPTTQSPSTIHQQSSGATMNAAVDVKKGLPRKKRMDASTHEISVGCITNERGKSGKTQPNGQKRNSFKTRRQITPPAPRFNLATSTPYCIKSTFHQEVTEAHLPRASPAPHCARKKRIFFDEKGLRVFGMLDPTVKPPATPQQRNADKILNQRSQHSKPTPNFVCGSGHENQRPRRRKSDCPHECKEWPTETDLRAVLHMFDVVGIALPNGKVPSNVRDEVFKAKSWVTHLFQGGEVIYRLAAAIYSKYGQKYQKAHSSSRNKLQGDQERCQLAKSPIPAVEQPQSVFSAWKLLKDSGVLTLSPFCEDKAAFASCFGFPPSSSSDACLGLWNILLHIADSIKSFARQTGSIGVSAERKTNLARVHLIRNNRIGDVPAPCYRKCPYITNEQISAAKQWMRGMGVHQSVKIGVGVFQDVVRNGVALCKLLTYAFPDQASKISYLCSPKTLAEVRSNVASAFACIEQLPSGEIPSIYLSRQALDGILLGDTQFVFGLVWHLWQYSQNRIIAKGTGSDAVGHLSGIKKSSDLGTPVSACTPEKTIGTRTSDSLSLPAIYIDIPAASLANEELRRQHLAKSTVIKTMDSHLGVPWEMVEGSTDIFPVPPPSLGPTERDQCRIQANGNHDDILPIARPDTCAVNSCAPELPQPTTDQSTVDSLSISKIQCSGSHAQEDSNPAHDSDTLARMPNLKSSTAQSNTDRALLPIDQEFSSDDLARIVEWLRRIGITLRNSADFYEDSAPLHEFQSGVLLCDIVEKLEHMRRIEGVCRKETVAKPIALHNISKALEILQLKKTMPLYILRRKNDIFNGDRVVILHLLQQMQKAYGHFRISSCHKKTSGAAKG